jgi:outer membrane protein OmpA-like peptidoglycan-associated protein
MQDTPTARLAISGHADATGTEEYNDTLSEQRARMVGIFLTANGVDENRLDFQWFGENELLVDTQKREEANRRVVITPVIE